jgi:hypothetical protein
MPTIISKYSDYAINSIDYFRTKIADELILRDLPGLTDGRIDIINVSKQHPIVTMMINKLAGRDETERSGIVPAISVTPSNPTNEGFTLGQGFKPEVVNDAFIAILQTFAGMTDENIQKELLITKTQIGTIIAAYRKLGAGNVLVQVHEWRKNEEINISVWSETPDMDILLGNLIDSIMADIETGFAGDNSKIKKMQYNVVKGLVNFNFGRVLFGTEYSLTFLNTYNNYTIYGDAKINDHEFDGTFEIPN